MHTATATETPVDETVLRGVGRRADRGAALDRADAAHAGADHAALDRVRDQLREELGGRVLTTCFAHGDFWLGNVARRRRTARSPGIVDWERAGAPGSPRWT